MASEIDFTYPTAALTTLYAVLHKGAQIVNATTGALATRNSANWAASAIALSDSVAAYNYLANVPSGTLEARFSVRVYVKGGATAALGDVMVGGPVDLHWDGTAEIVGANITHGNFDAVEPDDTLADNIASVLTRLGAGTVRIIGQVANYDLIVGRGESYNTTVGQTLVWTKATGDTWPSTISGWTITLNAAKKSSNRNSGTGTLSATGTVTQATGDSQAFRVDLTAEQTTGLAEGAWTLSITLTNGVNVKAIRGNMLVLPELPVDA